MRGSLITLQKLVQLFPDDMSLKNDLGVGYLLIGDNNNAQKVYEEVSRQQSSIDRIQLFWAWSFNATGKLNLLRPTSRRLYFKLS